MNDKHSARDEPASEETELLLRFLAHRDQSCPRCSYNLRNLTQPVCPECGEALKLTVGRRDFRDSLLFLALAPCIFSSICTILLNGLIAFLWHREAGLPPAWVWGVNAFGTLSGIGGLLLFLERQAFVKLDRGVQLFWALLVWGIHIAVFVAVLANL